VGKFAAAGAQKAAGAAQAASLDFQARIAERQAVREEEIAKLEAARLRKDNASIGERLFALQSAFGDASTGTNLLLQQDFARDSEFDALLVEAGGDTAAANLRTDATLRRFEGANAVAVAGANARATIVGGLFDLGTTVATTAYMKK
jgi:hypothetical protein